MPTISELEIVKVTHLFPKVYETLKAVDVESIDAYVFFAIVDGKLALGVPCEWVATKKIGGSDAKDGGVR